MLCFQPCQVFRQKLRYVLEPRDVLGIKRHQQFVGLETGARYFGARSWHGSFSAGFQRRRGGQRDERRDGHEVLERTTDPTRRLNELTGEALARGEELESLEVRRPTLEDVYLELTGE